MQTPAIQQVGVRLLGKSKDVLPVAEVVMADHRLRQLSAGEQHWVVGSPRELAEPHQWMQPMHTHRNQKRPRVRGCNHSQKTCSRCLVDTRHLERFRLAVTAVLVVGFTIPVGHLGTISADAYPCSRPNGPAALARMAQFWFMATPPLLQKLTSWQLSAVGSGYAITENMEAGGGLK